jgi:hypothetical protein
VSIRRTAGRSLGALGLSVPLLLASAAPALASGTLQTPTPSEGSTLGSAAFSVKASVSRGSSLKLVGPGSYSTSTSASSGLGSPATQTLTIDNVDSSRYPNGTWTASVSGGESRAFYASFAPAVPSGFAADGSGAHDVIVTWVKGAESDLQGYTLYDGSGAVLDDAIPLSACSGNSCSYALYYDNPTPGDYSYSYQLAARRAGGDCPGCAATLMSDRTATRSARLTTPRPPPSPTPAPTTDPGGGGSTGGTTGGGSGGSTGGGSTGGGAGGSGTGGTTPGGAGSGSGSTAKPGPKPTLPSLTDPVAAQRRAFALSFNSFSPSLGIPKLPPLPNTLPSISGGEAPLPQGTYLPELPYQPATETTKTRNILSSTPLGRVTSLDEAGLAKSIATALILVAAAAHLRRYLGAHVED